MFPPSARREPSPSRETVDVISLFLTPPEGLSPQVLREIAEAHRAGRRLYIGTTASESKRFVVWDVGAIANVRSGLPIDVRITRPDVVYMDAAGNVDITDRLKLTGTNSGSPTTSNA